MMRGVTGASDTTRPENVWLDNVQPENVRLGIDIGGTGMKAAPVDLVTGRFLTARRKIFTPQPATPEAMAGVVAELVGTFDYTGPVGVAFPSIVRHGVAKSAANIDSSWIGTDIDATFTAASGCDVHVVNDADAAGLAEMRYGAGVGRMGVVLMLTFGTGIGSALFTDGLLVPNTELGHLEVDGFDAETRASARAREREDLSWKQWAKRVNRYLEVVDFLFSPDLIIAGGGISRQPDKWMPYIKTDVEIIPAAMTNDAGIVGAALIAGAADGSTN